MQGTPSLPLATYRIFDLHNAKPQDKYKGFKAYNALQVFNCSLCIFIWSKSTSCYVSALETPASITYFHTWNASLSQAIFQLFIWHAFFAPHMTSSFSSTLWPFHYFHSMAIPSLHDNPNVTHQWNRCLDDLYIL